VTGGASGRAATPRDIIPLVLPTADIVDVALPVSTVVSKPRTESRQFYVRMAYACAFIAFAGFTPTYWAPVATGTFDGPPLLHVHGLLFFSWTILFVVQTRLAAAGRYERHRMLGLAGISLATAMLFAGMIVSIQSIDNGVGQSFERQARGFSIVPISIILFFAAMVGAAVANVRRPEVHMRLMLMASITLLPPAIARVFFLLFAPAGAPRPGTGAPPPVELSVVPSLVSDILLVVAIVHDWRTRGRPHPVYLIAGAAMIAVQAMRVPFSYTPAWHWITSWLLRLGS
jgi:hypothetical protein